MLLPLLDAAPAVACSCAHLTSPQALAAGRGEGQPVFGMVASGIILLGTLTVLILAYRRNRGP